MKEQQALRLCEALWESVNLGPGPAAPVAVTQAQGIIEALRSAPLGRDVHAKLFAVEKRFEGWFSERQWRGDDEGVFFRLTLQADISNLESSVEMWFSYRHAEPAKKPAGPAFELYADAEGTPQDPALSRPGDVGVAETGDQASKAPARHRL